MQAKEADIDSGVLAGSAFKLVDSTDVLQTAVYPVTAPAFALQLMGWTEVYCTVDV